MKIIINFTNYQKIQRPQYAFISFLLDCQKLRRKVGTTALEIYLALFYRNEYSFVDTSTWHSTLRYIHKMVTLSRNTD